jgi:hypothetical protein
MMVKVQYMYIYIDIDIGRVHILRIYQINFTHFNLGNEIRADGNK